jgi:hypothetical protein
VSRLRIGLAVSCVSLAGLLTGCGSARTSSGTDRPPAARSATGMGDAAAVTVIREWSRALRRGDLRAAASYFALPSLFANGFSASGAPLAVVIHTQRQAQAVNESLSCGARLISTSRHGKYITATFRLTNRSGPGAGCGSGTGQTGATDFVISDGRILDWIRAPVGGTPPKIPTVPANPSSPGQPI